MDTLIIDNEEELNECLEHLKECEEIAVDLEFDKNRFRYGFNICLIQISSKSKCYIVDPLNKNIDYRKLFPIFEDPKIQKIVYSFNEDIRLLHSLGCFPKNLFDINFGVLLLNFPKTSLSTVLMDIMDIEVGSSAQKSNWFDRPLSDKQIRYAAEDVIYLFDLKDEVSRLAKEKDVFDWIEEDNARMADADHEETGDKNIYPEKYKTGLNEFQWYVLENLLTYREGLAEKVNRPSFQVINPEILINLVKTPSGIKDWMDLRGIHRKYKTIEFQKDLGQKIRSLFEEGKARGLSEEKSAKTSLSREEWLQFKEDRDYKEKMKKEIFVPIQNQIAKDYGEFAMPNIIGKRAIFDFIGGHHDKLRNYQIRTIIKYGNELGLDVDQFMPE